ncbi:MAG: ABC transporter ATP-binding protein [Victivallales bacterium]|nr:ABC transporter ATP-binding protein [Victivallales bacterium]
MVAQKNDEIVVKAVGLTKIFMDFWGRPKAKAVNGIDFSIKPGEVFGLLGPNGSGKSTTIKMILGLLYPTRGEIKIFGQDPQNIDIKSRIGYLPEETYLYKYLTAFETLDFYGALFGLPVEQRKERATQLLEMVGMSHAYDRPVGEFSKGMARRIGLAQALVNDPDLVILDEPTSGLDPIGCREVKDVIRLLASRGKTVILCSHLLADVQDVCNRVMVLYGGTIRAQGELKDILREEDKTQVITPRLSPETIAELKKFFAAHGIKDAGQVSIDNPGRDLEEFFLNVVREASAEVATAGAHANGEIPAYLQGDNAEDASGQTILESLHRRADDEAAKKAAAETAAKLQAAAEAQEKKDAQLSQLKNLQQKAETKVDEAKKASDEASAKAAAAREELNRKLQSLQKK